jgi:transcriptional regulator with XRE-family HTH domain
VSLHTRKGHFLGAKLRALRKRSRLTLEELSARCVQLDAQRAPSVSYLSMIESGKRLPSEEVLALLASLFEHDPAWFLDDHLATESAADPGPSGAVASVPLEPAFLFSTKVLQTAIPELLAQTGTTGRQFAHLLIRSHQEMSRNDFPELERAAESVGARRFPLDTEDLIRFCRSHGLTLRWFDRRPVLARDMTRELKSVVRSFFEPPRTVYLNRALQAHPARLKFDLATHLGHKVLHGGDGLKSAHATGGEMGGSPEGAASAAGLNPHDVLHAWRDFECSFFAGALLAPKIPFRRFLTRESHRIEAGERMQLTPAVVMRRMTKVSVYPYWHFFDAYPPGFLRAVYRGNGIPLPWGNLAQVSDPCPQWAVFRMLGEPAGLRSQLADLAAARRRPVASVLLPFAVCERHGRQPPRAVGRDRPHARLTRARRRCRGGHCRHRRGLWPSSWRGPHSGERRTRHQERGQGAERRLGRGGPRPTRAHHLPAQCALSPNAALRERRRLARSRDHGGAGRDRESVEARARR